MKKPLPLLALLSSCSVVMASRFDSPDLQGVQTRSELIALGIDPIGREEDEEGRPVETYRILKQKRSIARACIHGLLDLTTLFAWELIGTPIEGALAENRYQSLKVTFDKNDQILNMEIQ